MPARASGHHAPDPVDAAASSTKPPSAVGTTTRLGTRRTARSVTLTAAAATPKTR
jgi:hypothetical protein